jgi:hypothetical protein
LLSLLFAASLPGLADVVSWSNLSLADNNGGAFLNGFTISTSGSSFLLNLPNFSQSDFAPFSGEVDLGLTVSDDTSEISALQFTYFGLFDGTFGSASYVQTSSGSTNSPASGTFSTSPFIGFLLFAHQMSSSDLTTQLNLNDNGGLAGITAVRVDVVAIPEPAMTGFLLLGVAVFSALGYRRRIR